MSRLATLSLLSAVLSAAAYAADEPTKAPVETRSQAVIGLADFQLLLSGRGMLVKKVRAGGPSTKLTAPTKDAKAGELAPGDVIVAVDGFDFRTLREWYDLLNNGRKANQGKVRLTVRVKATGQTVDWIVTPAVAEIEVPVAAGIRRPRITPIEDPMLPDLIPESKK